jgi:hypothetical protein
MTRKSITFAPLKKLINLLNNNDEDKKHLSRYDDACKSRMHFL